ncbi:hypothetical protein [Polaribacter sp. Hel1_85]|uniref:hypothetical protein n=1 Tax=Polaribacter sp. Hel1_85 TaxID=1250005 RepID=UPI00052B7E26|nr:hypothetical protein [Polaribacter sp. Hel1_85]KGL63242.1 conserved hypothetical membrane protein [Polaribacter sp. Hel1_85]
MKKYIAFLTLVLFLPIFFNVFSRDASVYAYMGTLLFEGKIPYIDAWDHKGISLYLINALGYLIGFKNYIGIRILEFFLILFSFFSIYKTLLQKYSKTAVFISVLFGLLSLKYFFDGGNLTEEYGAVIVLFALSLLLKENKKTLDYLLIGLLFVINLTIRANLISFWIALFFALVIDTFVKQKSILALIQKFLKIGLGIFIAAVILTIYFLITNSFSEFYNAAFIYNFSYAKQSVSNVIVFIIKSTRTYEVSLIMLLAFLIALISLIKKRIHFIALLLLFWVPLELYFTNMSGKRFTHYYMMWVPVIVLSTAFSIDYFKAELLCKEKQLIVLIISMFLFFQIPVFSTLSGYISLVKNKEHKNEVIANHINTTFKKESLLVWGNECVIYNLTEKRATVSNFYQTLFKLNSPITKQMIVDFTNQIKQNSPDVIIDIKTPSLLFLDKSNISSIDKSLQENLRDFFIFFENNYQLKETKNGVDFYIKTIK